MGQQFMQMSFKFLFYLFIFFLWRRSRAGSSVTSGGGGGGGRRKEEHLRLWKSTGARPINRIMKLKMKEDQRDE